MKLVLITSFVICIVALATGQDLEIGGSSKFVLLSQAIHSFSHWNTALEVGLKLRERGHRVVVASMDRTEKTIKPYGFEFVNLGTSMINETFNGEIQNRKDFNPVDALRAIGPPFVFPYTPALRSYLSSLRTLPDVIVCDLFLDCCVEIAKEFGIPHLMTTGGNGGMAANDPVWVPSGFSNRSVSDQSFISRLKEFYGLLEHTKAIIQVDAFVREIRANLSLAGGLQELMGSFQGVHLIANSYIGLEVSRPLSPMWHFLGPFFSSFPQPLDESLSQWLDEAQANSEAVVLMAFGGHVIPSVQVLQALLDGTLAALQALPNGGRMLIGTHSKDFLVPTEISHRVRMQGWIPQAACLAHPSVRLMIGHGGLNSFHESVWNGKPMLLVPIVGDQIHNAVRMQDAGSGISLDRLFLNAPHVTQAVTRLLTNASFAKNAARLRALARFNRDVDAAADIVELVASGHGDSYRPLSSSLPFLAAGSWDIYATIYGLLFVVVLVVIMVIRIVVRCIIRRVRGRFWMKIKQS